MASLKRLEGTRIVRLALRFSPLPVWERLSTSPQREVAITCARSLVAHGSFERMSIFAVRMRFRSALNAIGLAMPSLGAGAATGALPAWEESTPCAAEPPPDRDIAEGALWAAEQAARRRGAASRRASLRIEVTCFRRVFVTG